MSPVIASSANISTYFFILGEIFFFPMSHLLRKCISFGDTASQVHEIRYAPKPNERQPYSYCSYLLSAMGG